MGPPPQALGQAVDGLSYPLHQAPIFPSPNSFRQEEEARQGCHSRLSRWPKRSEAPGVIALGRCQGM